MPEENTKRLVAQKASIKDLLNGKYVKEGGFVPNYVVSGGKKLSRVNIMAVILSVSAQNETGQSSVVLDDGTGTINVRSFEGKEKVEDVSIGDVVLVVGRLREYNQERYVLLEIIRKIENSDWIELRKLELKKKDETENHKESKEEQEVIIKEEDVLSSSSQLVYELIKKLDPGDGADFDEIIKSSKLEKAEDIISNMLQEGELFEVRPGKLKVLE